MNNFPQPQPMDSLNAFAKAFKAGVYTTVAVVILVLIAREY